MEKQMIVEALRARKATNPEQLPHWV